MFKDLKETIEFIRRSGASARCWRYIFSVPRLKAVRHRKAQLVCYEHKS